MNDLTVVILHVRAQRYKIFYNQNKLYWRKKLFGLQTNLYDITFIGGSRKEQMLEDCKNRLHKIFKAKETHGDLIFYKGTTGRVII